MNINYLNWYDEIGLDAHMDDPDYWILVFEVDSLFEVFDEKLRKFIVREVEKQIDESIRNRRTIHVDIQKLQQYETTIFYYITCNLLNYNIIYQFINGKLICYNISEQYIINTTN